MPSISAMIEPWLGRTMPMMHFISVDLPLPLVPSSTTVSPASDRHRHVLDDAHGAVGGIDAGDGEATGQGTPAPLPDRASTSCGSPSAIFRPETSTTRRCEKLMTARMMCSIRMTVTPSLVQAHAADARMSSTSEWVRPAIDSSAIRSFGSAAMARASSSLRISTWVRSRGSRRALPSRPTSRSRSRQRASMLGCSATRAARRHAYRAAECAYCRRAQGWRTAAAVERCGRDRGGCADARWQPSSDVAVEASPCRLRCAACRRCN